MAAQLHVTSHGAWRRKCDYLWLHDEILLGRGNQTPAQVLHHFITDNSGEGSHQVAVGARENRGFKYLFGTN